MLEAERANKLKVVLLELNQYKIGMFSKLVEDFFDYKNIQYDKNRRKSNGGISPYKKSFIYIFLRVKTVGEVAPIFANNHPNISLQNKDASQLLNSGVKWFLEAYDEVVDYLFWHLLRKEPTLEMQTAREIMKTSNSLNVGEIIKILEYYKEEVKKSIINQ